MTKKYFYNTFNILAGELMWMIREKELVFNDDNVLLCECYIENHLDGLPFPSINIYKREDGIYVPHDIGSIGVIVTIYKFYKSLQIEDRQEFRQNKLIVNFIEDIKK